jgi:hypothetical protein
VSQKISYKASLKKKISLLINNTQNKGVIFLRANLIFKYFGISIESAYSNYFDNSLISDNLKFRIFFFSSPNFPFLSPNYRSFQTKRNKPQFTGLISFPTFPSSKFG